MRSIKLVFMLSGILLLAACGDMAARQSTTTSLPTAVPLTWVQDIKPLITNRDTGCTFCHTGADSIIDNFVKLKLTDYPFTSGRNPTWSAPAIVDEIIARVSLPAGAMGSMPPVPTLHWPQERVNKLIQWRADGLLVDAPGVATPVASE